MTAPGGQLRFMRETPPLVGTLGRCDVEYAAALILYAQHELDRGWSEPVSADEMTTVLAEHFASGIEPIRSWGRNPFLRPDWAELVERGFAQRNHTLGGPWLRLTPAALERVAPHLEPVNPEPQEGET